MKSFDSLVMLGCSLSVWLSSSLIDNTMSSCVAAEPQTPAVASTSAKPNVLLVLTDDLGFSDLGCYGSEIDTPNLDRLASKGVRFTQFYNTAKCHSSRVSLLSGRWCRQAGDESLRRAVTIPEALSQAGYFTAMAGKWHLDKQPTDFGFMRYFGHLSGACSYYKGDNTFRLNGEPWKVPASGFYTTVANVDHALSFLSDARKEKQPWFLYLAFNAPHAPLQPLEADYKKYLGRYDSGWDTMRAARFEKQQELGLFKREQQPSERPDHVPAWSTLTEKTRQWEAKRMAAYAALIDRVDQELGRLLRDIENRGELDNTVVMFFSDNGACPYDRGAPEPTSEPFDGKTSWSDSTGWAWARNSPFRFYKQNQYEGGIATPAIVHWPAGLKLAPGSLVHTPSHLVDVLPTVCEIAGASVPATWPGRELTPLAGTSLAPLLAGQKLANRPPIHLLYNRDRALRDGDWKIVSFQSQPWELYNLAIDRTERDNIAKQHTEIVERMVRQWHEQAQNVLHVPAKENAPVAAQSDGKTNGEWTHFLPADGGLLQERGVDQPSSAVKGKRKAAATDSSYQPRARIGTSLRTEDEQWILQCTGADPGLAFNTLPTMPGGPYALEFRIRSKARGDGELYWTIDAATILPKGKRLAFHVQHDDAWHDVVLNILEAKPLVALRLDPCSGDGEVRLESVKLKDASGKVIVQWP